jgi:ketosteroid isomerase-like protein
VLDVCDAGDKVAVAFRLSGRQVGPMGTAAGVLPPTGQDIALRVIDILTLTDGRISEITMVADELGALAAVGAARLIGDG